MVDIEAVEAGTAEIQAHRAVSGTVKGTGELELDIDGGGRWGGELEGELSAGLGTAVVPATMDLNLEEEETMKRQIPEITVKEPSKKGKIKWKMLRRETEDRGGINRGNSAHNGIREEGRYGLVSGQQHRGSIGWAYLMKCTAILFRTI
jgi:hypothetical protein